MQSSLPQRHALHVRSTTDKFCKMNRQGFSYSVTHGLGKLLFGATCTSTVGNHKAPACATAAFASDVRYVGLATNSNGACMANLAWKPGDV